MANKKTREEFIIEAIKIHGYKYDYSLVVYVNVRTKVIIIDKKYGTKHLIRPHTHLGGARCGIKNSINKREYFIKMSNIVHNYRYDYSFVIYINAKTKVIIIDKKYGTKHLIRPDNHLSGDKCCINNSIDKTEYFLNIVYKIHIDDNYDYSQTIYKENHDNVIVKDIEHDTLHSIVAYDFLIGVKCCLRNAIDKNKYVINSISKVHSCEYYDYSLVNFTDKSDKLIIIDKKYDTKHKLLYHNLLKGDKCCIRNSINKNKYVTIVSKSVHDKKYDYSLVNYTDFKTKLIIIDKKYDTKHLITFDKHAHSGKSGCTVENAINKTEYIIKRFKYMLHNFNVSKYKFVNYINNSTEIEIVCNEHGIFTQLPDVHLCGCGCPKCNRSKGEIKIEDYLYNVNIECRTQKKFKNCIYKNKLKFDFYLPNHNMCIEYDGEQHFKPVKFFGGEDEFKKSNIRDSIKNKYCKDNNIRLLRIPYWDFNNIEKIIKEELCL